jgi:hypothetical protein
MFVAKDLLLPSFPASALNIAPYLMPSAVISSRRPPSVQVSTIGRNSLRLTLLQTLCRREKHQVLCNQANPRSFAKTPGVGYSPKSLTPGISNLPTLRSRLSCKLVNAALREPPFVFMVLQIPFPAASLDSHLYKTPACGERRALHGLTSKGAWRK